jgi:hypothetical protein
VCQKAITYVLRCRVQREAQPVGGRLCWVLLSQMQALIISMMTMMLISDRQHTDHHCC